MDEKFLTEAMHRWQFAATWEDDIPKLVEMAKALGAEIERLKALVEKTYCAYCGAEFLLDGTAAHMVTEHIKTCEKHPMRKVEDLLSATELALDASNRHLEQETREVNRIRRMLDWALKPETQSRLQSDFDEHDRITGGAR